MTTRPSGQYAGGPGPRGTDNFLGSLRRIDMRRSDDSWIGGVCSGLAERLGIDPLVIRALFVVLSLGMGLGVFLYLAAWLLIPDRNDNVHLELALREGAAASVLLLVVTVVSMFGSFGWFGGNWDGDDNWGNGLTWGLLTLVIVVGGGWWVWTEWRNRPEPGYYGRFAGTTGDTGGATTTTGASTTAGAPPTAAGAAQPSSGATAWTPGDFAPSFASTAGSTAPPTTPPSWAGAATPPLRPQQPRPPKAPRRPGRRSAGAAGTLLGTGLALAAGGGLYWAATEYGWSAHPLVLGLAGALGALGLVILALGFAGRTSGFPGFLAIIALLGTVLVLPLADHFVPSGRVGDFVSAPTSATLLMADAPYRVGVGTNRLDLTELSAEDLDGQTIEASVSVGQLIIVIPEDLTVRVETGTAIGAITHEGTLDPATLGGVNVNSDLQVGDGPVDLIIDANVGIGQISLKGQDQ